MDELTAWLRATIEVDLTKARVVLQPEDQWYSPRDLYEEAPCVDWDEAEILTLYSPGAVIARGEAELDELAMLDTMPHYSWDQSSAYACEKFDPEAWTDPVCSCGRDAFVDRMTRIKAYGYRRRPGWREEWAPLEK